MNTRKAIKLIPLGSAKRLTRGGPGMFKELGGVARQITPP